MSEHWILIVVWIKIDDEWILIFYWICLTHWHIFVKEAAANGLNFLPVSVCTVGERHLYPLVDKATGVRVPDVIHGEAAGGEGGARQGIDLIANVRKKKSERGKKEVMQCLRQFHSAGCVNQKKPGIFNLRDFDHHREITNQTTFDGGTDAQCIGRLLAADPTCFPNTRSVVRDRAHAIRTNLKAPLASDPDLNRIKLQLLEKRIPWRSSFNTTLARKMYT